MTPTSPRRVRSRSRMGVPSINGEIHGGLEQRGWAAVLRHDRGRHAEPGGGARGDARCARGMRADSRAGTAASATSASTPAVTRRPLPEATPPPAGVPPATSPAPAASAPMPPDRRSCRRALRMRRKDGSDTPADGHRICGEGRGAVSQASRNGTLPIRAQCMPAQRRTGLRRGRQRDHDGDRGRIRQEGAARHVQGELTRLSPGIRPSARRAPCAAVAARAASAHAPVAPRHRAAARRR